MIHEETIRLFYAYSCQDDELRQELESHLTLLRRQGIIEDWHERRLTAGTEWRGAIDSHLEDADVILLLISAHFLASDYCYDVELSQALARHRAGEAIVIPIYLRPVDCQGAPFANLLGLPNDGHPITSAPDRHEAWAEVARGIRRALESRNQSQRTIKPGSVEVPEALESPAYPNEQIRVLSEKLLAEYKRKETLTIAAADTTKVNADILALRRQIRQAPQFVQGEVLSEGRYLLIDRVGKGGFATVWKAYDRVDRCAVAIKVLHSQWTQDRTQIERFFRGARQMRRMNHPNVVRVIQDRGEDDGHFYFVMEYLEGGDVRQAVLAKKLSRRTLTEVILHVGTALQHAHQRGVIHRDVTPGNILLDTVGAARLTDFDLVRAYDSTGGTRTGALGTFLYSAPESMERAQDAGPPADVFSLAMCMIFGLFGADLPARRLLRDSASFIGTLDCHPSMKAVLLKAVEWEADHRFQSVADFCVELREAATADIPTDLIREDVEAAIDRIMLPVAPLPQLPPAPRTAPSPSPRGGPPYSLRFISGKFQGIEIPLEAECDLTIGRDSDAELVLSEALVSRRHAKLHYAEGRVVITDLGSTNGTYVNGVRVKRAEVNERDRILIGTSIIKLVAYNPTTQTTSLHEARAKLLQRSDVLDRSEPSPPRLRGSISEIPLRDVLALTATANVSGLLAMASPYGIGKIYLREGKLYYASLNDDFTLPPRPSLAVMLKWEEGQFEMNPPDGSSFADEIDEPMDLLLLSLLVPSGTRAAGADRS